jgi:hypothetical protein
MTNNITVLLKNEYIKFYIIDTNIYIDSTPKEEQEKYDSDEILSHEKKIKKIQDVIEYFYNFWKLIEQENNDKLYILNFNINLVMINIPLSFYWDIKKMLDSLKKVFEKNLKESYFKIEHKLAKQFLDLVFSLYIPVKPIYFIN